MNSSIDPVSRREFLRVAVASGLSLAVAEARLQSVTSADPNDQRAGYERLFPRNRIPLSFIIDDSTCLVNMGHYCMPQFATAWPERDIYRKPWKSWPREIPDSFVREFGEWCAGQGVRGKYSIVPYPACVGWVDRELPGWSRAELQSSLDLVRELMVPNWDIHPEMITHTRVIDLKTGRPLEEISAATMENSYPREKKSVDELAAYLAYALRILSNCGLPCEGVTTPGGFGNLVKSELSLAVQQAVRDVYRSEIPHYFKYVHSLEQGTEPILEHVSGRGTDQLNLTVNVPAGTGDWFGGWDGDLTPEPDRYCNQDATEGRLVELIERGQPGVFLCHWPGIYSQGELTGFRAFQRVVTSINERYADRTIWMKPSEMARYWATRELATIIAGDRQLAIDSPFACPQFTLRIPSAPTARPGFKSGSNEPHALRVVSKATQLESMTASRDGNGLVCCIDLPKGPSILSW